MESGQRDVVGLMRATSQTQANVKCLALFTGEGLQDMETGTES